MRYGSQWNEIIANMNESKAKNKVSQDVASLDLACIR
jgi:hypothetical protein